MYTKSNSIYGIECAEVESSLPTYEESVNLEQMKQNVHNSPFFLPFLFYFVYKNLSISNYNKYKFIFFSIFLFG